MLFINRLFYCRLFHSRKLMCENKKLVFVYFGNIRRSTKEAHYPASAKKIILIFSCHTNRLQRLYNDKSVMSNYIKVIGLISVSSISFCLTYDVCEQIKWFALKRTLISFLFFPFFFSSFPLLLKSITENHFSLSL